MKNSFKFFEIIIVFVGFSINTFAQTAGSKPNILMIVADDYGFSDAGFNRDASFPAELGVIPTPNLDALAAQGVICTSGHVAHPFCGPSRAALMTGRYPQAIGAQYNLPNDISSRFGIDVSETFISKVLQDANYNTSMVGKWHLGAGTQFQPKQRGFDDFFGMLGGGHPYFEQSYENNFYRRLANGRPPTNDYQVPLDRDDNYVDRNEFGLDEYLTDILTDDAILKLQSGVANYKRDSNNPYFMYLAYNAPHTPLEAPALEIQAFKNANPNFENLVRNSSYIANSTPVTKLASNPVAQQAKIDEIVEARITYATMVTSMDANIGRIVTELKKDPVVFNNTLIVFFSDNGGKLLTAGATNFPLRQGKGSISDGGHKVPMFFHWPNKITPGTKYNHHITTLDMYPTFANLAGGVVPSSKKLDGKDIMDNLIANQDARLDDPIFILRHFGGFNNISIKEGDYKIVRTSRGEWQLFDLGTEGGIREEDNVRNSTPNANIIVNSLVAKANAFYSQFSNIPPGWFDNYRTTNKQIGFWEDGTFPAYTCTFLEGAIPAQCFDNNRTIPPIYNGPSAGDDPNVLSITDFDNLNKSTVGIYPNPFKNSFSLDLDKIEAKTIAEIYSLNGQLLKRITLSDVKSVIDASILAKGVYVLKIKSGNELVVQKIIKN